MYLVDNTEDLLWFLYKNFTSGMSHSPPRVNKCRILMCFLRRSRHVLLEWKKRNVLAKETSVWIIKHCRRWDFYFSSKWQLLLVLTALLKNTLHLIPVIYLTCSQININTYELEKKTDSCLFSRLLLSEEAD